MRHQKKGFKLGRTQAHRKATLAALSNALIEHKRITTTLTKARALRMYVEPLINRSKEDTMHNRRQAFRRLQDKAAVTELFSEIASKVADRPGGYTRVIKLGQRAGDSAEMAVIELVDYNDVKPFGSSDGKKTRTRRAGRKRTSTAAPVAAGADGLVDDIADELEELAFIEAADETSEPTAEGKTSDEAPEGTTEEKAVGDTSEAETEEKEVENAPEAAAEEEDVEEAPEAAAEEEVVEDAPEVVAEEEVVEEAPEEEVVENAPEVTAEEEVVEEAPEEEVVEEAPDAVPEEAVAEDAPEVAAEEEVVEEAPEAAPEEEVVEEAPAAATEEEAPAEEESDEASEPDEEKDKKE
ncbi:MAG: 50S ribosomal protein L17 [Bacteroidetes bacterium]|nr:50S ribosomal protein L17 [Bacteroidota bacterium]